MLRRDVFEQFEISTNLFKTLPSSVTRSTDIAIMDHSSNHDGDMDSVLACAELDLADGMLFFLCFFFWFSFCLPAKKKRGFA